jgi:hypothetical protein
VVEVVGDDGVRTDLFFRRGEIIFAEQGTLGETLGRLLLRERVLSQEQYAAVIERMTERLVDTEQLRFGEAAVQLGFADPQQIHEALTVQVQRKATRCLSSYRVDVTLRDDPDALDDVSAFPTRVETCVLAGMREHYDDRRLDHILFDVADQCPVTTGATGALLMGLPLMPIESRIVATLHGEESVLAIIRASEAPLIAKRILGFLRLADALEFASPAPARVTQVFAEPTVATSLPRRAAAPSPEEDGALRAAVSAKAVAPRAPTPDAEGAPRRRPLGKASAIAIQIARAVGRSIPPPTSHKRARLEAEKEFAKGQRLAAFAKWDAAYDAFHRASRCMPEALEYGLHAVWAEVMTATTVEDRQERLKAAGVIARQAMKQEPNLAYAHYVEGNVALELGREEIALKRFRRAAAIDPAFTDAVRHARILQRRLEK